jgi:hypothetical protein
MLPKASASTVNIVGVLLSLLIAGLLGVVFLTPLRLPRDVVRQRLLWRTPIGSDSGHVLRSAAQVALSGTAGSVAYGCPENGPVIGDGGRIIGASSIHADLGSYRELGSLMGTMPTVVSACWAFDKRGGLTDIVVTKGVWEGTIF